MSIITFSVFYILYIIIIPKQQQQQLYPQVRSDDDDEDTSTATTKGKTWGPSTMSHHQRERGFLPSFSSQERSLNLVKSAPNLDNKSRSSSSTDNILLGNRADLSDRMTVKSTTSINSHNYTNTNYHSIFYERDLMTDNGAVDAIDKKEASMTSINSHNNNNNSNESIEYDSDDSVSNSVSIGCFSFVGNNSSTTDGKKSKGRYKKYRSNTADLDNRQLLQQHSVPERKSSKGSNSRKNSADPKRKIQFEELTPKAQFNFDLTFYKRIEQSVEAVGSRELSEEDLPYARTKPKNKLAMRLQKSLDAIDSYDLDEDINEKVYSKSIDDLSTGSDYQWFRAGSQFTRQCFFRNGSARNGNRDSESSQESSTVRKSSWPHAQY